MLEKPGLSSGSLWWQKKSNEFKYGRKQNIEKTITFFSQKYHRRLQQYWGKCTTWAGKWVRDQNLAFYPPCFTKAAVTQGESFSYMHSSLLTEIMHTAVFHSHHLRHPHNGINWINKGHMHHFYSPLNVKKGFNLFFYTFLAILATTFAPLEWWYMGSLFCIGLIHYNRL